MFHEYLQRVAHGIHLSQSEMMESIDWLMTGRAEANEIASFLLDLSAKGETVDELAGAAQAMRRHMVRISCQHNRLVDTCGTGGVGSEIFNVSTTAALVAAAAGAELGPERRVAVAKHGNRSVTSKSGSADVLRELGIDIEAPPATIERCLNELGIGFCFAPQFHPAMRHVGAVRKQLGVRTVFNLLGPLCNPAGAPYQLLGVGRSEISPLLAAALQRLGTRRSVVVCGTDGVGEVTVAGVTEAIVIEPSGCRTVRWVPEDFGLAKDDLGSLRITGVQESATLIRRVLDGEQGAARKMVLLNAAAALWTADSQGSLTECVARAEAAIDSGAARNLLIRWAELSCTR